MVFYPLLNTLSLKDLDKNIPNSIESGDGLRVFMEIGRERGINSLVIPLTKLQFLMTAPQLLNQLPSGF